MLLPEDYKPYPEDELLPEATDYVNKLFPQAPWRTEKYIRDKVTKLVKEKYKIGWTRAARLLDDIQEKEEAEK